MVAQGLEKRSPKLLFNKEYIPFWWLSISFLVIFLAYNSVQAIEATVNKEVGAASVGVIYVGLIIGNLIAPALVEVVFKGNLKYAMGFGGLTYSAFIFSSLYPRYWLMLPVAFIMGVGAGVMWIAQGMSMMRFSRHIAHQEQDRRNKLELDSEQIPHNSVVDLHNEEELGDENIGEVKRSYFEIYHSNQHSEEVELTTPGLKEV